MTKRRIRIMINIILILLFVSCNNYQLSYKSIKSGFLYDDGIYTIPGKDRNILIKELKDGSKIFAIRNSKNKILFQQSLNETFSAYHYWVLYVDKNADIWYYNSDYFSSQAVLFNKETQQYEMKDLCRNKIQLPLEFKKEIESKGSKICTF
ncbi:hypothetical protein [Flavobacterium ginsenosidimutans]|uniref:Lipoprotein n=1 Tax=Flavobacterium ginsenosidimutans TaxID=687844 RepID=A0ABZ2Q997_9FLAO|nr:hypothetical protein [Flavobacterium ginsenosidimutans]KAF2330324.1 hypothetical protein DM444_13310 [Flavobacterium ginsenosidimutans]